MGKPKGTTIGRSGDGRARPGRNLEARLLAIAKGRMLRRCAPSCAGSSPDLVRTGSGWKDSAACAAVLIRDAPRCGTRTRNTQMKPHTMRPIVQWSTTQLDSGKVVGTQIFGISSERESYSKITARNQPKNRLSGLFLRRMPATPPVERKRRTRPGPPLCKLQRFQFDQAVTGSSSRAQRLPCRALCAPL
jgi:hypothetical protein